MPGADATRETGARERRRRKDHRPHHHRRHASNSSYDAREPILRARDGAEEARDAVDDDGLRAVAANAAERGEDARWEKVSANTR